MIVQVICWTLVVTMIFFVSLMKPIKAALHAYLDAVTEGRVLSLKRRIEKRIVGGNNHHYSYHLIENYEIRYQHDMKNSNVDNGDSPSAICSYLFEHEEARDLHIPVPLFDWNVSLFGSKPALEQAQDKMESTPSKWQEGATLTVSVVPESPRAAMVHNDKLPLTIILIYLFLHFNLIILGSFLGSFLFLFEGPFQDGVIRYIPAYACTFLGCGIIAQQQRLRISAKPIIETVVVEEDCYQSMSSPGKASTENSCLL